MYVNTMITTPTKKGGFTLIETLVAITILLIALAGPLTIAAKGLSTAYYARDQITAFYLAQEGIEYLRNIRDAQALYNDANPGGTTSFPQVIIDSVDFNSKFTIDATLPPLLTGRVLNPNAISRCPVAGCSPLLLNVNLTGDISTYGYAFGATPTQFIREITITQDLYNSDEYQLTAKVSWNSTLPNHSFTLVEDITKWHE